MVLQQCAVRPQLIKSKNFFPSGMNTASRWAAGSIAAPTYFDYYSSGICRYIMCQKPENREQKRVRGLRARRQSAEQETRGSQPRKPYDWRKGGTVMVKNVFSLVRFISPTALTIFGWLAFAAGLWVVEPFVLKLVLMSAARVLP